MTSFTNTTTNYPTGANTPIRRVKVDRPPTTSDRKNFILGDEWLDTSGDNWWKLVTITANSAVWKRFADTSLEIQTLTGDSGGAISPNASNNINILGTSGQITVTGNAGTNTLTLALAGGGTAIDSIAVDASTAPGTNPVAPTAAGLVTMTGAQVATGTVGANVLRTNSVAANALRMEIQRTTTAAATDSTLNGVSHFNSAMFSVDASGFVSLSGGGQAIDSFIPDSGTSPVVPTAAGAVTMAGSGSITTVGGANSLTTQLTGLTNHAVLVGAGTSTITKVGPSGSTGQILQNNAGADPSYSTATYPSTTTINQILYSSAADTVAGLATANRAVLTTGATGIPVLTPLAADGQLIIGSTAGVPAAATLTAGSGVSITNGSNSITIGLTGGGVAIDSFIPDSGTSPVVPNASGEITMTGGNGIATVGGTNQLTFDMESPFTGDFTFRSTTSGDTETLTVSNTSDTASSQAQILASVAGESAGDTWMQWTVGTSQSFALGIDNSDSNKLKLNFDTSATVNPSSGTNIFTYDNDPSVDFFTFDVDLLANYTSVVGGLAQLGLQNTDASNTSSAARLAVTTQSTGGDPYISFDAGTPANFWEFGVDNSASDVLQITSGGNAATANLSGNVRFQISTAGAITFNNAYTFPTADGTAGQTLVTNGAGVLTFQNAGATGWTAIGANQTLAVNEGYICTGGGALSLALPATSAVGDEIEVALNGSTSWTITQPNAGSRIRIGTSQTTLGVGGTLASTNQGDSVRLVCVTANATWMVVSSVGNFTVV